MENAFTLSENEKAELTLHRPGEDDAANVGIRRAFPWSKPAKNISIRSKDGKELLLIDDLNDIPAAARTLIESVLAGQSFIPRITRIRAINMDFGYQQWSVETDRGSIDFRVQEREDIRFHHDGRFSVKDADGNHYVLPRVEELDAASQKAVELLL